MNATITKDPFNIVKLRADIEYADDVYALSALGFKGRECGDPTGAGSLS